MKTIIKIQIEKMIHGYIMNLVHLIPVKYFPATSIIYFPMLGIFMLLCKVFYYLGTFPYNIFL